MTGFVLAIVATHSKPKGVARSHITVELSSLKWPQEAHAPHSAIGTIWNFGRGSKNTWNTQHEKVSTPHIALSRWRYRSTSGATQLLIDTADCFDLF